MTVIGGDGNDAIDGGARQRHDRRRPRRRRHRRPPRQRRAARRRRQRHAAARHRHRRASAAATASTPPSTATACRPTLHARRPRQRRRARRERPDRRRRRERRRRRRPPRHRHDRPATGAPTISTVTGGRGDITGGEGSDVLEGGALDDMIRRPRRLARHRHLQRRHRHRRGRHARHVSPTCENVSIAGHARRAVRRPPAADRLDRARAPARRLTANDATTLR